MNERIIINFDPMNSILARLSVYLLLFTPIPFTCAQNVQITIGSMDHADITQSLICISDVQGNVYFEQFLSQDEIETGAFLNPPVPDPEHYCLSIINEYRVDSINAGSPFIWARTFYNLSNDIHILRFEHPLFDRFYHSKPVLLDIQHAVNIDFWQHATSASISRWQQNKDAVWAQPDVWPDEDLFVVMKSSTESRYRYVYTPQDKLPRMSDPVRVSDAIQLDWKTLKTDVRPYSVKCPLPSKFTGSIYAINSQTGNRCVFFDERHKLLEPAETLDLFIPPQPLEGFQAEMEWYDTYKYSYRIVHGYELNFPHYDRSKFEPATYVIDSTRIQTTMNPFPEFFRIMYTSSNENEGPRVGYRMSQCMTSHWIVVGKNTSAIDFTLPRISQGNKAAFSTMERWWIEYFENVKVLEENTDIDVINFYRDYNLLRVIYRDPYKE